MTRLLTRAFLLWLLLLHHAALVTPPPVSKLSAWFSSALSTPAAAAILLFCTPLFLLFSWFCGALSTPAAVLCSVYTPGPDCACCACVLFPMLSVWRSAWFCCSIHPWPGHVMFLSRRPRVGSGRRCFVHRGCCWSFAAQRCRRGCCWTARRQTILTPPDPGLLMTKRVRRRGGASGTLGGWQGLLGFSEQLANLRT